MPAGAGIQLVNALPLGTRSRPKACRDKLRGNDETRTVPENRTISILMSLRKLAKEVIIGTIWIPMTAPISS